MGRGPRGPLEQSDRKISGPLGNEQRLLDGVFGAPAERTGEECDRIACAFGRPGSARFLLEGVRRLRRNVTRTRDRRGPCASHARAEQGYFEHPRTPRSARGLSSERLINHLPRNLLSRASEFRYFSPTISRTELA